MKKLKMICFTLILIIISINNASAKEILHTCEYFIGKNELSTQHYQVSALCNIYTDYSHQCYVDWSGKTATTKSNKESILNWKKKYKDFDWVAKEYVTKNNKCPDYLLVEFSTATNFFTKNIHVSGIRIYAAPSYNDLKSIESLLRSDRIYRANPSKYEFYHLPNNNSSNITQRKENVKKATKDINDTIASYSLNSCKTINECKSKLDAFKQRIEVYKQDVQNNIDAGYLKEEDDEVRKFRAACVKSETFLDKAYRELEEKEKENNTVKKTKCEDYTFAECLNKTDLVGNVCERDLSNYTCKKKRNCKEYFSELNTCPPKSDYDHTCELSDDGKNCIDKGTIMTCEDYNDPGNCPEKDDNGAACKWSDKKGCIYKNDANDIKLGIDASGKIKCEDVFDSKFGRLLKQILSLIRFAVPILIIGLSIIDYIKALAAQNADEIKKVTNKLVKRLIIGILIFLLPTLLDVLLNLAGVAFGVCELG